MIKKSIILKEIHTDIQVTYETIYQTGIYDRYIQQKYRLFTLCAVTV